MLKQQLIKKLIVIVLISSLSVSCSTMDGASKQSKGTSAGAIVGAILAGALAKKKNRRNAIIGGLIVGGFIGNRIGAHLDKRDRAALAKKIKQTANIKNNNGKTIIWKSNHSDAVAKITPKIDRIVMKKIVVKVKTKSIPTKHRVTSKLIVRQGPNNVSPPSTTFNKEEELAILALTKDKKWAVVAKKGKVVGYVNRNDIRRNSKEKKVSSVQKKLEAVMQRPSRTREIAAIIPVRCRSIQVRTKVSGKVITDDVKTCQSPNGSWGA